MQKILPKHHVCHWRIAHIHYTSIIYNMRHCKLILCMNSLMIDQNPGTDFAANLTLDGIVSQAQSFFVKLSFYLITLQFKCTWKVYVLEISYSIFTFI